MAFRGPFSVPPGNGRVTRDFGDQNCQRCKGRGYVPLTSREIRTREEIEALTDFVFGAEEEGFGMSMRPRPPEDNFKYCPECQLSYGTPNYSSARLRALRVLARRRENGETFKSHFRSDPVGVLRENPTSKANRVGRKKSVGRKSGASRQSLVGQLAQLAELREAGALTAEEFKMAKQRLLNSHKAPTRVPTRRKTQRRSVAEPEGFGGPGRYL